MKFIALPSDPSESHYIYLYLTATPAARSGVFSRPVYAAQRAWLKRRPGRAPQRAIFRIPESHYENHERLYTSNELDAARDGWMHVTAFPFEKESILCLEKREYLGLWEGLDGFFREADEGAFGALLSYRDRDMDPNDPATVMSRIAIQQTTDDIREIQRRGREAELLNFLKLRDPELALDKIYLAFTHLVEKAGRMPTDRGSIAMVKDTPKS